MLAFAKNIELPRLPLVIFKQMFDHTRFYGLLGYANIHVYTLTYMYVGTDQYVFWFSPDNGRLDTLLPTNGNKQKDLFAFVDLLYLL